MPMKLNVGISRKLGLPEYSSVGASCNVELELEGGLLQHDPDAFHAQVRSAFAAAHQAVNEELARFQAHAHPAVTMPANGHARRNGAPVRANGVAARSPNTPDRVRDARSQPPKPATASQVHAIYAIARANGIDLAVLLGEQFGVEHAEELSLAQASQLIDQLKTASTS